MNRILGSLKRLAHPEIEDNALPWHRSLTFVINHDVPYNEGFRSWLLDPQDEHLAYAYILGKDGGVPLIFSVSSNIFSLYIPPRTAQMWLADET